MNNAWMRFAAAIGAAGFAAGAYAQIPDLLNAFEMGGRGFGMGGAIYSNSSDASASYWNPAGLAHMTAPEVQINFRNRPTTNTTLTGTFVDPERTGTVGYGHNAISFGGVAIPVARGTLGVSYALGGWAREQAQGQNLTSGDPKDPTVVELQQEVFRVATEFITVAWGTSSGTGMNWGAGLVFARQHIADRFFQRLQPGGGGPVIITEDDVAESATGFGGIIGLQYTPPGNPNVQLGVSYRSEIRLSGFDELSAFSNAIPARLQGGIVFRRDGFRGGRDYMIMGVDVAYFFAANRGLALERDGQVSAGAGIEYNLSQAFGFVPIRVGVRTTQRAGENFSDRNSLTFGVGYRPTNARFMLDFGAAVASGQSRPDMALSVTFPFGR